MNAVLFCHHKSQDKMLQRCTKLLIKVAVFSSYTPCYNPCKLRPHTALTLKQAPLYHLP